MKVFITAMTLESMWSLFFITSLLHFASTLTMQNEIKKNQNEMNFYITSKRVVTEPTKIVAMMILG